MKQASSGSVVGYTVVVAQPAHMMPRSATIQSSRVPARIATRSSWPTPRVVRPAAMALARAPICAQVNHTGLSFASGPPNARAFGVEATRLRNMSGMDLYGTSKVIGKPIQ
jgi:hypothetical protein